MPRLMDARCTLRTLVECLTDVSVEKASRDRARKIVKAWLELQSTNTIPTNAVLEQRRLTLRKAADIRLY